MATLTGVQLDIHYTTAEQTCDYGEKKILNCKYVNDNNSTKITTNINMSPELDLRHILQPFLICSAPEGHHSGVH